MISSDLSDCSGSRALQRAASGSLEAAERVERVESSSGADGDGLDGYRPQPLPPGRAVSERPAWLGRCRPTRLLWQVPPYLRFEGRIRNRRMAKNEVESIVKQVLACMHIVY